MYIAPLNQILALERDMFWLISDLEAEREEGQVSVPGHELGREAGDAAGPHRRARRQEEVDATGARRTKEGRKEGSAVVNGWIDLGGFSADEMATDNI